METQYTASTEAALPLFVGSERSIGDASITVVQCYHGTMTSKYHDVYKPMTAVYMFGWTCSVSMKEIAVKMNAV